MQEQSAIQMFLSYASPDKDRVLEVYEYLIRNGYPNVWIDCKKLLPGQPWEFEIQRNLHKSEIIIIFLSQNSVNKRGFVQKELKIALKYLEEKLNDDIYIVPIKLDSDVIIPDELTKIQWLDLNTSDALLLLKQSLDMQSQKLGFEVSQNNNDLDEIHLTKKIIRETWEGLPGYEVEFSIPIFHSTKFTNIEEVTKIIEVKLIRTLHSYRTNKLTQMPNIFSWSQNEFQRIDTFDAHYDKVFHKNYFLSIHYTVHWYGAGAAHPNHYFLTFNFLLNPLIQVSNITEIFDSPDKYFEKLATYVRSILLNRKKEPFLDKDWVIKGTQSWDFFSAFSFNSKGLEISFEPYQVGAYATGSHFVLVPYDIFYKELKRDFRHALSLNIYD